MFKCWFLRHLVNKCLRIHLLGSMFSITLYLHIDVHTFLICTCNSHPTFYSQVVKSICLFFSFKKLNVISLPINPLNNSKRCREEDSE
jgi:hypothetical protein